MSSPEPRSYSLCTLNPRNLKPALETETRRVHAPDSWVLSILELVTLILLGGSI